jgi:hypothetical protein
MGMCPRYSVTISGEGAVAWHGIENVRELGPRRATVSRAKVQALATAIDEARFFELDDTGNPMIDPTTQCTRTGTTTTCSFSASSIRFCTDTPHAIVTVRRGGRIHRIDDAGCEATPLNRLAELIDRTAGVERWR